MSKQKIRNSVSEDGSVQGKSEAIAYSAGAESSKTRAASLSSPSKTRAASLSSSRPSVAEDEESWTPFIISSLIGCVAAMSATMLFRSGGHAFK
jgi:hypothetical protein